ncbi:MAG: tRNA (adenosine(37)-N6)-dimethylallyltransferase MiaA [Breznakibacter sp.]
MQPTLSGHDFFTGKSIFPLVSGSNLHAIDFQGTPYNLVAIVGPTASGKTKLAANLAYRIGGEVICADSRQVYKGMDIGTGKDYADYVVQGQVVRSHLMDLVTPGYKYNVYEYQADFYKTFADVAHAGGFPVMCGGSGLYIEAVLGQYKLINVPVNPELRQSLEGKSLAELAQILSGYRKLHNKTDTDTIPRAIRSIEIEEFNAHHQLPDITLPEVRPLVVGVGIDTDSRRARITKRLKERLDEGMVDEVKALLDQGVTPDELIYYGLEYKYLTLYVTGTISYNQMFDELNIAIHQFAKRQMTWFRRMERNGFRIHWVSAFDPMDERVGHIEALLKG